MHIETERLRLRVWEETDRRHFATLNADPIVMNDLGGPLSRDDSDAKLDRYLTAWGNNGYGRWLVETISGDFLGYCGVMPVRENHPLGIHDEIGWRLIRAAWGHGYATEAARAALIDAFRRVRLEEVLAYTDAQNIRSQAVMRRLRLRRDASRDFAIYSDRLGTWRGLVWTAHESLSLPPEPGAAQALYNVANAHERLPVSHGMSPEFREFVNHPRYGQGPRITGLNPENDFATGRVFLHWHSPEGVRIPNTALPADLSRQVPATVPVTHYFDAKRQCADCGRPFIFFAAEQKYWYEELGFPLESDCVRCVVCRKKQQGLESNRHRYEELFHVQERTPEQNLEMAECALSLVKAAVFGKRQLERVRRTLKTVPSDPKLQALWERVHALEGRTCDAPLASRLPLQKRVEAIERDLAATARAVAREELWVTHYGAFDIHPRHLAYWICVKTDTEKHRLQADEALLNELRQLLVRHHYPSEGRDSVHIGFESQETIDRESGGNWWYHWK